MNKTYRVSPNLAVDAPKWWAAASSAQELPKSLWSIVLGTDLQSEISWDELQWCKTLPHWDGLDGWPLKVTRIS